MPWSTHMDGRSDLPLTRAQEGIWLGQELEPTSARYNAAECITLPAHTDAELLVAAIGQAVDECDALRVRFVRTEAGPRQRPCPERAQIRQQALAEADVQGWMRADLQRPIDLTASSPYRGAVLQTPERVYWYHAAHHIALDGYGFGMIARRVSELYGARVEGRVAPACPFGALSAVVDEDLAYRQGPAHERDRAFWHAQLSDMTQPVSFTREAAFSAELPLRRHVSVGEDLQRALSDVARRARGTWGDAMIAALAAELARDSDAQEVVLGLPVMNRLGSAALKVPCMAMNIVPLRIAVAAEDGFLSLIERVVAAVRALRPHSRYRYEQLRRELGRVGGDKRLFGPVVNLMPFDLDLRFAGERARVDNLSAGPVDDLALGVTAHGDGRGLRMELDANPRCYAAEALARIERGLVEALEQGVRSPDRAREVARETVVWGPALPQPAEDVLTSFARQVRLRPDAVAVEDGALHTSYRALDARARALAARLSRHGVGTDDLVALELPRSTDAIVAQLAVLMAGAAYLPLDVDGPVGRRELILDDARPKLIVNRHARGHGALPVLRIDAPGEEQELELRQVPVDSSALAYVIYTSGSTGKPNGVAIERGALSHFTAAARERYGFHQGDRALQFAPLHFDACVEEIFGALCCGATLVLRDDAMMSSLPAFARACEQHGLSVLDLPTAFFHELAFTLSSGAARLPECVRIVIIGGEAALPERVARFRAAVHGGLRLFNTYGPTEATVVATCALLTGEGAVEGAPIGAPLPGVGTLIVDGELRPVRAGAAGELLLLGPGLARGYLHRPELSTRRFTELGHARAYRTGDLVRRGPDGLIFVGRGDDELKISGQRVDPSEVEGVLLALAGVREACVVASEDKRLIAYVVGDVDARSLRRHAQSKLLAAAVPQAFVQLDALPRTRSGKVDRKLLRAREQDVAAVSEAGSELERQVLTAYAEVLGRADLGLEDDFFERGGQSLQTMQVANRLGVALGREIDVALVFRNPSAARLARALSGDSDRPEGLPEAMLADARLPAGYRAARGASGALGEVLLTGASGFVGVHLLHALLARTSARVTCLIRAEDELRAYERLHRALHEQELRWPDLGTRVRVVPADLSQPALGLEAHRLAELSERCDTIVHCAASVSLTRGYESLRACNVLATRELLQLATRGRPKTFHHVSTIAVGRTESFVPAHAGLGDGYTQSKWAAERLVEQARERGLDASVYRLGRVVGPLRTGFVNRDDIVWRVIRAGVLHGALPVLDVSEPWTPVDFLAEAMVRLAQRRERAPVYNLTPAPSVSLRDVFAWVRELGHAPTALDVPAWVEHLRDARDDETVATRAFFELRAHAAQDAPPAIECEQLHRQLPDLTPPVIDRAAVHRYLAYAARHGLLPEPRAARRTP